MRKITTPIPEPLLDGLSTTTKIEPGNNTVTLSDVSSLNVGDLLLFEEFGSELSEVKEVTSINGNVVTVNGGFLFEHPIGVFVNRVLYDEFVVKRNDEGIVFVEVGRGIILYDNQFNNIEFLDETDGWSLFKKYEVYGYNSVTETETLIAELGEDDNIGFITPTMVWNETGLSKEELPESLLVPAIIDSVQSINDNITVKKVYDAVGKDYSFVFNDDWFLYDFNADGVVDKNDLYVYEYDSVRDLAVYKNYLINKITNTRNAKRISFNKKLPLNNSNELKFFVPSTYNFKDDINQMLRTVSRLMISNYILSRSGNENLFLGVSNWNAAGVSVSRDTGSVHSIIDFNNKQINSIIQNSLVKVRGWKTKLRRRGNVHNESFSYNPYNNINPFGPRW